MKSNIKFFRKGVLFILGFFLIILVLQVVLLMTIKGIRVGDFGVLNQIDGGEINTEILISGSSRGLKAINPEVISELTGMECYNISTNGTDLEVQLPKLKWYLNHNKKPEYLIQDLSQFGGVISQTIYEPYKYLAYLKDDSLYTGLARVDKNLWMHKYFYPSNLVYYNFGFYVKVLEEKLSSMKDTENLINGFSPDYSNWRGNIELFKEEYPDGIKAQISSEYRLYLDELVRLCKSNDIKLILVVLPNFHLTRELIKEVDDINAIYSSYMEPDVVYYMNYSNDSISENEANFFNFTHLNKTGADKLSQQLATDIIKLN